ncbi:MAG TPA: phasin family protein [Burkholderiales bacterium]|nr:phasin family protein [Burkholderiales bacterium]
MYQAPEQLITLGKANFEIAVRCASIALEGAERLLQLQITATKEAFADGVRQTKTVAEIKDLQELARLKESLTQPAVEKAASYAKNVYDVVTGTQSELGGVLEEQIADLNKHAVTALDRFIKSAPAGSEVAVATAKSTISAINSAYDNFARAAKQFADLARLNMDTLVSQSRQQYTQ